MNEVSVLSSENEGFSNPLKVLSNIRQKNSNRLIIAQLNINSIRNKFSSLANIIENNIDIFLTSETKIDSSFPTAQFHINGFTTYRRDRNENGGGLLLYVREDIPSNLLRIDSEIEAFYIELNIRKKRFLLCCSYNPNKNQITKHLAVTGKNLDTFSSKYDDFILIGDLNSETCSY